MRTLIDTARKSTEQVSLECTTAYTSELLLGLHRGKLDIAIVDLPIRSRGIGIHPIYSEPLIAVMPRSHPLAQRPMMRLFELKKEQLIMISRHIDPGSVRVEAMLRTAGMEPTSLVTATSLIELLGHVPVHRSIGLMRSSAGRLRRDDVLYKPLADSVSARDRDCLESGEPQLAVAVVPGYIDCVRSTINEVLAGMSCNIHEDC